MPRHGTQPEKTFLSDDCNVTSIFFYLTSPLPNPRLRYTTQIRDKRTRYPFSSRLDLRCGCGGCVATRCQVYDGYVNELTFSSLSFITFFLSYSESLQHSITVKQTIPLVTCDTLHVDKRYTLTRKRRQGQTLTCCSPLSLPFPFNWRLC